MSHAPAIAQAAPWKPPYTVLPDPGSRAQIESRLGSRLSAVWLEGDVLTIAHRDDGDRVTVSGGIQLPMQQIPGTNLWAVALKMPAWRKAFLSYTFLSSSLKPGTRLVFEKWYGPEAPPMPIRAAKLHGTIVERTLHSESLDEDRKITVYLPPSPPAADLPAFFLADGQSCESWAQVLEPLIEQKKVRPCAIVGVHSSMPRPDPKNPGQHIDRRAEEYLSGHAPVVFRKHLAFFTGEVMDYVVKEFHVSRRREDHAVAGFSNGGGFAFDAAAQHPEIFAHALPFSASHGLTPRDKKPDGPLPSFHFAGGELEYFGVPTRRFYEEVQKWGAPATLDFYTAGHDPEMWELAFGRIAPSVFPPA
jgi:enterochelin esterase-like enzyme